MYRVRYASLYLVLLVSLVFAGCSGADIVTDEPDESVVTTPEQTPTVFDDPDLVREYQNMITPEGLASYLFVLASDHFEGRETAMPGQRHAAEYLAGQYRKLGITPVGTVTPYHEYAPEAYFQPFPVYGRDLIESRLTVHHDGETLAESSFTRDYPDGHSYLQFGDLPDISGDVVFAGYGIMADDHDYNDYAALQDAGLSPSGSWVMMLDGEPLASANQSLLTGGEPSQWSGNRMNKYRPALSAGAQGLLIVGDVSAAAEQSVAEEATNHAVRLEYTIGNLSLEPANGGGQFPPLYIISEELADAILSPTGRSVAQLQEQMDSSLEPEVFALDDVQVESSVNYEGFEAETENVVAYIEGTDPELSDEVIVFTAHYDHVGIDPTLDNPVYNGADDDGSGTVALLKLAEAFKQAKDDGYGPRRSIVFLSVSAEEKGLLGSAYYADEEPIFPLENTVANFNLDMISRSDPNREEIDDEGTDYVYIIGSRIISQDLDDVLEGVNVETGISMTLDHTYNTPDDPNQFYRRSDQWNFGKHNIPFIFYFTGVHEDYHQPGDEPHLVDYDKHARVTRLVFATAWQIANQDERPEVTGEGFH